MAFYIMKKPIAIIFNDTHLKVGNEYSVLKAFRHMIKKANEKGITRLIFAGDLFDSRSFQRLNQLNTLDTMLSEASIAGLEMDFIPGNHDKTVYSSYDSFLDVFTHYPGLTIHRDVSDIEIEGVKITLVPFFIDDMLIPKLKEATGSDVLISHFEMAGSTNLGRTSEKTSINPDLLSKWKKTYLGHYHNHHEITKDIVHLPSFLQGKFGEDSNKGFSILYSDLSYSIEKGDFREYVRVDICLDTIVQSELNELIRVHENSSNTIRFEFTGKESKLKALDRSQFKDTGIDVKLKYEKMYKYDASDVKLPTVQEIYGKGDIKKTFKQFCEDKGYEHEEGKRLLDEFFQQQ